MEVADKPLQFELACSAPTLKPGKRVVMKMSEPCLLILRPQTQTNPEALARALGENNDAPILLTQLALNRETIDALQQ